MQAGRDYEIHNPELVRLLLEAKKDLIVRVCACGCRCIFFTKRGSARQYFSRRHKENAKNARVKLSKFHMESRENGANGRPALASTVGGGKPSLPTNLNVWSGGKTGSSANGGTLRG